MIAKKIITINYATYAVAERKPEENSALLGFEPVPLRIKPCNPLCIEIGSRIHGSLYLLISRYTEDYKA